MIASPVLPAGVMKHLATLASAARHDAARAKDELARLPVSVLDAALDSQLGMPWTPEDRVALLELLSHDPRDYVRSQVAAQLSNFGEPLLGGVERMLQRLCNDAVMSVRQAAVASLATLMQNLEAWNRTRIIGRWVMSDVGAERAAIGQALRWSFDVAGVASAIELLAHDDDPEVRAAAAEAAKLRLKEAPMVCGAVLTLLARDPDPRVARAASLPQSPTAP